jgi:hypothetical protein
MPEAVETQKPTQLTPNDPVGPEALDLFRQLAESRARLSDTLLALELEKIQVLGAARQIESQQGKLMARCLTERGLAPNTAVSIDPKTGVLTVIQEPEPLQG